MPDVLWAKLKSHDLRKLARRDAIVIVPVAAMEQHGPHLPVQVDTMLCNEVARRGALKVAETEPIVVTPAVWCGLSEHHMSFGGTITLDFTTFYALIRCIVHSLVRHGFKRILLLNGHGGNITALNVVVGELTAEFDVPLSTITYWQIVAEAYAGILERQATVRHAGEAETSMVLAIEEELVDRNRLEEAHGRSGPERQDILGAGVFRWQSFAARTDTGVIGDAELAGADKGERLLEAAATALAEKLLSRELWAPPI